MSTPEDNVLQAIINNPFASQQDIANQLNMSRESVAGHIMRLTRQGKLLGKGYILPTQNNIVVIGGCNLDITGSSFHHMVHLGDSNPGIIQRSAGGVARNIAENLARLGQNVSLISAVGLDQSGDWLIEQGQNIGIDMSHILRHSNASTGTYMALNNAQGALCAAVADMSILDDIDSSFLHTKTPVISATKTLLIDANINSSCIDWLATQNLPTAVYADAVSATKATNLISILPKITALKANREEAKAIICKTNAALPVSSDQDLLNGLLATGVKRVLLSIGREGVWFADQQQKIKQGGYPVIPVNDTGAGDALLAAFVHGDLSGWAIADTLAFACANAAMTLSSSTACNQDLTESVVKDWISLQ